MANISAELAAIMAAIRGEDVRGSIYSAIDKINKVEEVQLNAGTDIYAGDSVGNPPNGYENSIYIRTDTDDILKCNGDTWSKITNLRGASITSITGPVSVGLTDTYTIHITKDNELILDVPFTVHNGNDIVRIDGPDSDGLIDTYTIVYADDSTYDFNITNGNGIVEITGPESDGLIDTYTIVFEDGSTHTFEVTNGRDVVRIDGPVSDGLIDTYTIVYADNTTYDFNITNGNGIKSIELSSIHETTDTYTITFDTDDTEDINITNGNKIYCGDILTDKVSSSFTAPGFISVYCRVGDMYINSLTGDVYACTKNGAADGDLSRPVSEEALWTYKFTITAPKGDKGDKGDTGDKGDKGEDGTPGAQGVPGRSVTSIQMDPSGTRHMITVYYSDGTSADIGTIRDGADGSGVGDMNKSTYDINDNGYVDLAAALTDGNNIIPTSSVKNVIDTYLPKPETGVTAGFVPMSDGSGDITWASPLTGLGTAASRNVDNTPTSGSNNLVTSGGVYSYINTMITEALSGSY